MSDAVLGTIDRRSLAVASQWQLVWWAFRRHRLAMISAAIKPAGPAPTTTTLRPSPSFGMLAKNRSCPTAGLSAHSPFFPLNAP